MNALKKLNMSSMIGFLNDEEEKAFLPEGISDMFDENMLSVESENLLYGVPYD